MALFDKQKRDFASSARRAMQGPQVGDTLPGFDPGMAGRGPQALPSVGGGVAMPGMGGGGGMMDQGPNFGMKWMGPGGILPAVGGAIKDYGPLALAGLSAWEAHQQAKRQEEMQDRALAIAEEENAARRETRERGLQGLRDLERPDLSGTFADPYNVYDREARKRREAIPSVGGY